MTPLDLLALLLALVSLVHLLLALVLPERF